MAHPTIEPGTFLTNKAKSVYEKHYPSAAIPSGKVRREIAAVITRWQLKLLCRAMTVGEARKGCAGNHYVGAKLNKQVQKWLHSVGARTVTWHV
ncbi:MAG: hypothetical protein AAF355_07750 [Myxococcota bacterium]